MPKELKLDVIQAVAAKLITVTTAQRQKGFASRNSVFYALAKGKIDSVDVDEVTHIIVNEKYEKWGKKEVVD